MKYYEILDIPPDATAEQIRSAYRILVQLHHPDRLQQVNPSVRQYAEERLKKINEAYTVLSDPERRARYDAAVRVSAGGRGRAAWEPAAWESPAWEPPDDEPGSWRRGGGRRSSRRRTTAEEAAYDEWAHREAERYAQEREAAQRRREAQEAEHRRQAEERARRAAEEQFPRARTQGQQLIVYFAPGTWAPMARIPAGPFVMGSDPDRDLQALPSEQPQHRVDVSEFHIGRYPVTNAQFQAFVSARPARLSERLAGWLLPPGRDSHPVVDVSWDDAMAFCQWLSAATGRAFRLPTEAEWEKAARGPADRPDSGRIYPWGDTWDAARLNGGSERGTTTPVGHYSPMGDSPYGLADMSGNVWEWCADWYDPVAYARQAIGARRDPKGPEAGEGCVVRGGAFDSSPRQLRCAHRNWYYPFNARPNVGFRLVGA